MEKWKSIPGFNGAYEASNLGRIRRCVTVSKRGGRGHDSGEAGHIMALIVNWDGYVRCALWDGHKQKFSPVHRLVALAFHGDPPTKNHIINHKDGVKGNNVPDNIEWVTRSENHYHSLNVLKNKPSHGEKHWKSVLNENAVRDIRSRVSAGEMQKTLAEYYGVTQGHISFIVSRKLWAHVD